VRQFIANDCCQAKELRSIRYFINTSKGGSAREKTDAGITIQN